MTLSLTLITLFLLDIVLDITIVFFKWGISKSSNNEDNLGFLNIKVPVTIALSLPFLIFSEDALSPNRRSIESIINDLPAPVSPVKTVKPFLKENREKHFSWYHKNSWPKVL